MKPYTKIEPFDIKELDGVDGHIRVETDTSAGVETTVMCFHADHGTTYVLSVRTAVIVESDTEESKKQPPNTVKEALVNCSGCHGCEKPCGKTKRNDFTHMGYGSALGSIKPPKKPAVT